MGERPLYSVDPSGSASPINPPTGASGGEPPRAKTASKVRPKYPVPTDRMKFSTQVQALVANVAASRNGEVPVDAVTLASYLGVAPTTATLNQAFFVDVGLVNKTGKGTYKPTPVTVKFQQEWSFDKTAAPKLLAPLFEGSWFLDAVKRRTQMGPTTREAMIQTFAGIAQTDSSYATQYGFLLDWLEFVGIISTEGGNVILTGAPIVATVPPEVVAEDEEPAKDAAPFSDPTIRLVPKGPTAGTPEPEVPQPIAAQRGPAVIDLTVTVYATADDLARLTGEQIAALFEGLGKVAAVKAVLAQG